MTPHSEWARICKELGVRLSDEEIEHDCLRYVLASINEQASKDERLRNPTKAA